MTGQKLGSDIWAQGFSNPVDIDFDNQGNAFVTEKFGTISLVRSGSNQHFQILDITDRVQSSGDEQGLLGLAIPPNFQDDRKVYVNYTKNGGTTVIARYSVNDSLIIDPSTEEVLLTIDQPYANHNGGCLTFGPEGYLYVGMGDGGAGGDPHNNAQNPQSYLGKILRIDVQSDSLYAIPPDNPFAENPDTLKEIWALGVRNPWKFSFDKITGDLYIGDVGQDKWEEVDFTPAGLKGLNYGWRCYEGDQPFNTNNCQDAGQYTLPVHVYRNKPADEGCSVTGGFVYRGDSIPYLYGKYIYGDFCSGRIWALYQDSCHVWHNELVYQTSPWSLSTFGIDPFGEIYYGAYEEGIIYKLKAGCAFPDVTIHTFDASCLGKRDGFVEVDLSDTIGVTTTIEPDDFENAPYPLTVNITVSTDEGCENQYCTIINPGPPLEDEIFIFEDGQDILASAGYASYLWFFDGQVIVDYDDRELPNYGIGTYQVIGISDEGCQTDTSQAFLWTKVIENSSGEISVCPNPFDNSLEVKWPPYLKINSISVYDENGKLRAREKPSPTANTIILSTGNLVRGVYILRVETPQKSEYLKVVKR